MSSRHYNRQPRRNLSKVEQQIAAEQAERDKAIRQQRRREYLARKEKRERNSSSSSPPKAKADSRPAWMIERDRQRGTAKPAPKKTSSKGSFEGNTFFMPGQKRLTKKSGQAKTLGQVLPGLEKQLNSRNFAPATTATAPATTTVHTLKISQSAFSALGSDSEDEEEAQEEVPTSKGPSIGDKTSAQQQQTSSLWSGFRDGVIPKETPAYQSKPAPGVTVMTPEPTEEVYTSSDSEEEHLGYTTDGDYESDQDFDEDTTAFDEVTDSWDL